MNQKAKRNLRARLLLHQDGLCHYCRVRMRLVYAQPGEATLEDACTIEHLFPKGDPRRGSPNDIVLACYRCNSERGEEHGRWCQRNGHARRVEMQRLIQFLARSARWLTTL